VVCMYMLTSRLAAPEDGRAPKPRVLRKSVAKNDREGKVAGIMALIKLNRINKGGQIIINSEHILFVEIESRVTTVHMKGNLLFSVEEPLDSISEAIEAMETARISKAIQQSGLTQKPALG
jgi:hypothetical protein